MILNTNTHKSEGSRGEVREMALIALPGDGECTASSGSSANSYNARREGGIVDLIALSSDGDGLASSGSKTNSCNAR